MALPSDYWRNPQMHNVFRTKPCQRLIRAGTCAWGSQCQFSHSLHWPRRLHRGHQYSPALCPHIIVSSGPTPGEVRIENACPEGPKCWLAHSKEEVLYHPHILKTCLCEEHASRQGASCRGRRKRHCHRHYCPFAHGTKELRASPLPPELRKQYLLDALNAFPSNWCCKVCEPQQVTLLNSARQRAGSRELCFVVPSGPPPEHREAPAGAPSGAPPPGPPWPAGVPAPVPAANPGSGQGGVAAALAAAAVTDPAWAAAVAAATAALQPHCHQSGHSGALATAAAAVAAARLGLAQGQPAALPGQLTGSRRVGHSDPRSVNADDIFRAYVDSHNQRSFMPPGFDDEEDDDDDDTDDTPLPPYGGEKLDIYSAQGKIQTCNGVIQGQLQTYDYEDGLLLKTGQITRHPMPSAAPVLMPPMPRALMNIPTPASADLTVHNADNKKVHNSKEKQRLRAMRHVRTDSADITDGYGRPPPTVQAWEAEEERLASFLGL